MYMHPEKFVRQGPFWSLSKKNQRLQKIINHANGYVVEPGGREIRIMETNSRFNYKLSQQEGEDILNTEE